MNTERALVRRLKKGDKAALRDLYKTTFAALYKYVYFRARENHDISQDVVHDTFLEAIKSLSTFSPGKGTLRGWLWGIARNRLRGVHREIERHANAARSLACSQSNCPEKDESCRQGHDGDMKTRVNDVLSLLPERYASVLIKKYIDRKSVRDIAETFGQSEKAVESLLGRARTAFRQHFHAAGFDGEGEGYVL